jgi:hypothetical protein
MQSEAVYTRKVGKVTYIQGVTERRGQIWARVPQTKTRESVRISTCLETFDLQVESSVISAQNVLREIQCTSHYGPPHPCKDAGAVADSLTGIHSVHKGSEVSPQVKIQRIQMWRGGHAVGPSLPIHRP